MLFIDASLWVHRRESMDGLYCQGVLIISAFFNTLKKPIQSIELNLWKLKTSRYRGFQAFLFRGLVVVQSWFSGQSCPAQESLLSFAPEKLKIAPLEREAIAYPLCC